MLKLLQINVTANWGSTGKIAEHIGLAALENGWESYIAYGRDCKPSKSKTIKIGNQLDVYEHYLENRLLDKEGLASRRATKNLIEKIKGIHPDIIQLHNIHDHYLNYKILFEYLNTTNIPVVWTFHDCWAFTGHCYHFDYIGCEKWKSMCNDCPMNKLFIDKSKRNFLLKKLLFTNNNNLNIVAVSQWMADYVNESFLARTSCEVIRNGIDLSVFHPTNKKKCSKFQVLAVSNVWNKTKGLYDIFELRKLLDTQEYDITIVGLTQRQLDKIPIGIFGIKRTQSVSELCDLYSFADVLINPTYADTFPTVNLEALACGTPVITYKTGGSPETIDENTGSVIQQGNINNMAAEIKNYFNKSEKERAYISLKCRECAEKYFNKDNCFNQYINLYNQLLNIK